ncbi:MAG: pre-peptidase C-terminal domain-containing protein, partial [Planctomycetales bacterium]|nr:pre-peptidase C-terminal domain-containing protein [Planctomycetales bacterium]
DLSGKAGRRLDVVLAGLDGIDFSGQLLELLDDAGNVLATASADPLGAGANAENFDLGITNFVIPDAGSNTFTLRLSSAIAGQYGLIVTEDLRFDVEPNQDAATPLRDLDQVADALGYLTTEIVFAAGEIEPDDFASGTVLNTVAPGVTLSVGGVASEDVLATATVDAPTGSLAFSAGGLITWTASRPLVVDFAEPIDEISIAVGSDDSSDVSFLSAYDDAGNLLATINSTALSTGQMEVLAISRPEGDIASVRAGGVGSDAVLLDHLQFHGARSANAGDAYQISLLAGQSVTVFTDTPFDGAAALPSNNLDPKLTLIDSGGQLVASDANTHDGKNAELVFTATVAGNYTVRVEQESGEGAYLLRTVKGAIPADFDQDGAANGADFLVWQRSYGTAAPNALNSDGDANHDMAVDGADLKIWQAQFGIGSPSIVSLAARATTMASTPEPAAETPYAAGAAETSLAASPDVIDAAMAVSQFRGQVSDTDDVAVANALFSASSDDDYVALTANYVVPRRPTAQAAEYAGDDAEKATEADGADEFQGLTDELLELVFA